jgi:PEP-CTERM motif
MHKMMTLMVAVGGLALAPHARATPLVLTFDSAADPGAQQACTGVDGGAVDRLCFVLDFVGGNYGSTSSVTVSYDSSDIGTSLISTNPIFVPGVSGARASGTDFGGLSKIIFTPLPGFEVAFESVDYFNTSQSGLTPVFLLTDSANATIASFTGPFQGAGLVQNYAPFTSYFSGPITFGFGGTSNYLGIDNVRIDVRAISTPPGVVPEPASLATMLMGLGLTGGVLRRRSAAKNVTTA